MLCIAILFKSFIFEVGFNVRESEIHLLSVGITLTWNVATHSTNAVVMAAFFMRQKIF